MKWNVKGLIQGLEEIHLLDKDFEYEPTLQTGKCHIDNKTPDEQRWPIPKSDGLQKKLRKLADRTNTEYILDRLDDDKLYYLVNNWDGIMKELKEKYNTKQLDKNILQRW